MQRESPLKKTLGIAAGLLLGGVLLVASWAKLLEPGAFAQQIRLEGLDFWLSAGTVAVVALVLETGLGMALVLGLRDKWVLAPTGFLVAFFLFLTGRNYWMVSQGLRDPEESCGCFGSLIERTPAEAFWQDLFLLVPPLLVLMWTHRKTRTWGRSRWVVSVVLALAVGAFVWVHPELKFTDVAAELADAEVDQTFQKVEGYQLFQSDEPVGGLEVYESEGVVGFFLRVPEWPVLVFVDPRTREFFELEPGNAGYLPSLPEDFPAGREPSGNLRLAPDGIHLTVRGEEFRLALPGMG